MISLTILPSLLSIIIVALFGSPRLGDAARLASDGRDHSFETFPQLNLPTTPKSTYNGLGSLFGSSLVHYLAPLWPQPKSVSVTQPGHSYLATGMLKISDQVARTKQSVMYAACEARPPIIYSRITLLAFWAVYEVRGTYCMPYYRAKYRPAPISAPPTPPSPPPTPPPPPPPPPTQTEGVCLIPSRTFTTSADRPAEPAPAHIWLKHGTYALGDGDETAPLSSPAHIPTPVDEPMESGLGCHPSRLQELRAGLDDLPAEIELWMSRLDYVRMRCQLWGIRMGAPLGINLTDALIIVIGFFLTVILPLKVHFGYFDFSKPSDNSSEPFDDNFDPTVQVVVHYAYRLTVKAERFEGESMGYESEWVVSGDYDDRLQLEERGWADVGCRLRSLESQCTDELIVVGVEVNRITTVVDVLQVSPTLMVPNRIDKLCVGPETFWSQTWLMSDSDVLPAYIEELPDTSLYSLGLQEQN
ncbi:hypothetical protein RhiJN_22645 [Ceratobasidium sp. AG-Ba]|nr:hypothetical protein RhiJN_22645 [Ceratobasidium sp. AG-Ba]